MESGPVREVSRMTIFCAMATEIHWLNETVSSLARRSAAAFTDAGSLSG